MCVYIHTCINIFFNTLTVSITSIIYSILIFASNTFFVFFNIKVRGIEFEEIDCLVNYYIIDTYKLNSECTSGFISGGLSPVNGEANYTMVLNHNL